MSCRSEWGHILWQLAFEYFSWFFLYFSLPIKWIWDMLWLFENICLDIGSWISSEISGFGFNFATFIPHYLLFSLWVLLLILVWAWHQSFIAGPWLKLILMEVRTAMHFYLILDFLFVSLLIRVSLKDTLWNMKVSWLWNSTSAWAS